MDDKTQVQSLDENALVDLFGVGAQASVKGGVNFTMGDGPADIDLINTALLQPTPTTAQPPAATAEEEAKRIADEEAAKKSAESTDVDDPSKEVDLLDTTPKPGRKPKYDFSDLSGYYQDRVKNKKFVAVEEEDKDGNKMLFVPKTPEEFDEVIDIQVNYRLDKERKDLAQKLYEGRSPAWRAVMQYAEMVDDPTQMLPFLQGVKNIQSVANLNADEIDGAEAIIRTRLEQRGDPEEAIDNQIEALKTANKLIPTAQQYKPVIIQQEQQALAGQIHEQREREKEYVQIVSSIREGAVKAIEQPLFGKIKLKQDEKAAVYDLIAEPTSETQGYGIYTAIDQLFDKGDFDTLRQLALLLTKKNAFFSYLGTSVADNTAASLQKKLTVAGESRQSSGHDFNTEDEPVVKRNQFSKPLRFGS